jgi:molybdopterin-containing oxidoreductase family membrane subunit
MVVSVHSVVGLDFAGGITPGWHDTQFPPYFFFGAVISGTALVIMLTILVRWGYRLHDVITGYHLNALGKVMLVGSLMLTYAYVWEAFGPLYGSDIAEKSRFLYGIAGFYAPSYWTKIALNAVIPQLLWLPFVRRSEPALFAVALCVIVGMWLERFAIVVPSLAHDYTPSYWGVYFPTLWDWAVFAGSIGLFLTLFFLLLRFVPIVAMAEMRELIEEERPR